MTFSILDHLDKLNHLGRGRYNCPVCNGRALTINKKTGAYRCFSGECESALIRNAIAPLPENNGGGGAKTKAKTAPKPKAKPVYISLDSVTFGRLPEDRTYPERIKSALPEWTKLKGKDCIKTIYEYDDELMKEVIRIDVSGEKDVRPFVKGKLGKGDHPWNPYRLYEALVYGAGHFVVLVEGEKCVEAMRWLGIPAITFQGAAWTEDDFSRAIAQMKGTVAGLLIIPDHDEAGYRKAEKVAIAAAAHSFPALVLNPLDLWRAIPERGDVADWIKAHKDIDMGEYYFEECFEIAIERAIALQAKPDPKPEPPPNPSEPDRPIAITSTKLEPHRPETRSIHGGSKILNTKELLDFIDNEMANDLKFDDLSCEIFLNDEPLKMGSDIKFWFLDTYGEAAKKDDLYDVLTYKAKQNSFNPVQEYLEHCQQTAARVDISNIASRYFGTVEPIFDRMVEMWLISAVARVFMAGCQVDHTLILQSGQGKYKSTWFKTLGGEWFSDSVKDIDNKDSLLTLHRSWIIELSELDRITSRKQAGAIKHFLTQREDTFRKPYEKEVERNPRRAVFCGTVNPARFLVDDENRRFWIIPIGDHIPALDIALLEKERDGIWAAAVDAFLNGSPWYPSEEEKALISLINKGFEDNDVWLEPIETWISHRPYVSVYEIMKDCFNFEPNQMQRRDEMRIAKVLTRLGWVKETRRLVFGKYRRVRVNPAWVGQDEENIADNQTLNQSFIKIDGEVGKVGISPPLQSFEDYRPTDQPQERSVYDERSVYTNHKNGVGSTENLTPQGFDQPTDIYRPTSQTSINQNENGFSLGDRVVDTRNGRAGQITALPEIGITWVKKLHGVQFDNGDNDLIALCYLRRCEA